MSRPALLLSLGLALAACEPAPPAPAPVAAELGVGSAQTFRGDVPCASCPGQTYTLTLFPDGTFRSRRTDRGAGTGGSDVHHHDLGRWERMRDDHSRITLHGGAGPARSLQVLSSERLRMRMVDDTTPGAQIEFELSRQPELDPIPGPMRLSGTYLYMADAGAFHECLTDRIWPVPIEGAHLQLEQGFIALRQGERPVFAILEGRFETREPEPGARPREHLIATRVERMFRDGTCTAHPQPVTDLMGEWQVSRPLRADAADRSAHALVGVSLQIGADQARFGAEACATPEYRAQALTDAAFSAEFGLSLADIGVPEGALSEVILACAAPVTQFRASRLLVAGPRTAWLAVDSELLVLRRR